MALLPNSLSHYSHLSGTIPTFWHVPNATAKKAHTPSLVSFGVSFDLSANHPDLLREAHSFLPLACRHSASLKPGLRYSLLKTESAYRLRRNGRPVFSSVDRQDFLDRFHSTLTLDVAERSRQKTFIHSGVVGWAGFAILIPGRSFAGKTTLVAELLRAGATYLSDEFAVIDQRGRVHPYPRALQIRENGGSRQTSRPASEFSATVGSTPLPVKLILVTRYRKDGHWRPRSLSPGIGLLQLLDNTVSARRWPANVLQNLKQVVPTATIVRGVRGEASQLVDWIGDRFGSPQTESAASR